jgi:hypothetical protein
VVAFESNAAGKHEPKPESVVDLHRHELEIINMIYCHVADARVLQLRAGQ